MKLTDYIASFLANYGIRHIFIFTGGAIAHFVDSVYRYNEQYKNLKPICVMHEQAGAMAVDAYSRVSGKIGAMAVTSGPGATNLITGIACSYYDSIPGIYFAGQVRTGELLRNSKQRQVGFQETDVISAVKPFTNYAVLVTDPNKIRYELEKSIFLSQHGRPGPVLIDLPMDVQWAEIDPEKLESYQPAISQNIEKCKLDDSKIDAIIELLISSKKPILISGGGIRNANAMPELKKLSEMLHIPVCVSFSGVDSFPHDNSNYVGVLGSMGNCGTNLTVEESDLVLALGTRLTLRQVKSRPEKFAPNAKIIHVDIDSAELNQRVRSDVSIASDAKIFLKRLIEKLKNKKGFFSPEWVKQARKNFELNPFCKKEYWDQEKYVNPYIFMSSLSKCMDVNDIMIADAGQNVMWAMQTIEPSINQRVFTSFGHSPMGYSMSAAIGAAVYYGRNDRNIICTIGDGGIQLNIQELQTIYSYNLPIKIFVLNNHSYGAIQDYQDVNLGCRYFASAPGYGYEVPNILDIAKAYKIPVSVINTQKDIRKRIKSVLKTKGPVLCDVDMGSRTYVTLSS